ncbi:MAG: hypothetical protein FLDDKLPJ_02104 [Phycisphaerae bacterium]|nr:hypothetical protein [Phycisphaerae bacterium]
MNQMKWLPASIALVFLCSCATRETRPPEILIQEFRGETKAPWRSETQLAEDYARVIDALMPGLSDPDELIRQPAEQTLEDLGVRAGRPGAERERKAACRAMSARLGPETAQPARLWLLRQLARIGKGESVAATATLLSDEDAFVRDAARRALENNPDRKATAALEQELAYSLNVVLRDPPAGGTTPAPKIADPAWTTAILNSLTRRGYSSSATLVATHLALQDGHPDVAEAALLALGRSGAIELLDHLFDTPGHRRQLQEMNLLNAWAAAQLEGAERLLAARKKREAAEVCARLLRRVDDPRRKVAALSACARAEGSAALARLLHYMNDADPDVRIAAAAIACRLPADESVTRRLADRRASLPPDVQVRLIDGLAQRGGPVARGAVVGCLDHPDVEVRTAAARAMARVGQAPHVRLLARIAAERSGDERKAAQDSLIQMRDPAFNAAAAFAVTNAPPLMQSELLAALKARRCDAALAWSLRTLPELEPAAQIAALDYIATVGPAGAAAELCRILPSLTKDEAVASAAENAVVSAAQRRTSPPRSAEILEHLASADAEARPTLLRILGRIGEPEGLDAIRYHLASSDAPARDAAVRALCGWKDASARTDVESLMRSAADPAHRQLAFRAFIRLEKTEPDRSPRDTLARFDEALTLVRSADEKKLLLSGMSDLACPEALDRLEAALADAALQAEAAVALCAVAKSVCGQAPDRARAALERVRAYSQSDVVKRAVDEAAAHLDRYQGYVTTWKIAGPFSLAGKDANDLFDTPLGPEPGAESVEVSWRVLPVTDPRNPWLFDLTRVSAASHQAVYVRATVASATATPARLEVGSDDCVKVWLNGELVHANKAFRPLAVASDTAQAMLREGANELLVKVVQGSGGWGVCCGVKASDGGNLSGLTITTE